MAKIKEEKTEEVLPGGMTDSSEYTFMFRECDIVPELARKDQEWETNGKSKAINEILLIAPELELVWEISGESASEDGVRYAITATVTCNEETHRLIKEKYNNYLAAREIQ